MNFEKGLLAEVKRHELLYNVSSPDYKNILLKDKVWKQIGARLGVSDQLCKSRWRTLRDTYKRNKARLGLRSGSDASEDSSMRKWKYFHEISFLDNINSPKYSSQSIKLHEGAEVMEDESKDQITIGETAIYFPEAVNSEMNLSEGVDFLEEMDSLETLISLEGADSPKVVNSPIVDSPQSTSKSKRNNTIQEQFSKLLESTSQQISQVLHTEKTNRTVQLLEVLGRRIERAELTEEEADEIELELTKCVFNKLKEFRDRRDKINK